MRIRHDRKKTKRNVVMSAALYDAYDKMRVEMAELVKRPVSMSAFFELLMLHMTQNRMAADAAASTATLSASDPHESLDQDVE